MKSMTGFGYTEYKDDKCRLALTLKSYNNRFLDILVYLPIPLSPLEPRCRKFLSGKIQRGRVEMYLKSQSLLEDTSIILNSGMAKSYKKALHELAETTGIKEDIRLSHLLRFEAILKTDDSDTLDTFDKIDKMDEYWRLLEPVMIQCFEQLERMRVEDGKATRDNIEGILSVIDSDIAGIEVLAPQVETEIKKRLNTRFHELLNNNINIIIDENRILAETAVMLMKCDINEELVRIRSHLKSFHSFLKESGAVGKKLDFLCQELNREVNTISSKSMLLEVNKAVVSLKDSLERIREQLKNVE